MSAGTDAVSSSCIRGIPNEPQARGLRLVHSDGGVAGVHENPDSVGLSGSQDSRLMAASPRQAPTGSALKAAIVASGLSAARVATLVGVSKQQMSRILNGERYLGERVSLLPKRVLVHLQEAA